MLSIKNDNGHLIENHDIIRNHITYLFQNLYTTKQSFFRMGTYNNNNPELYLTPES